MTELKNLEYELQVLSAAVYDPQVVEELGLTVADFADPRSAKTWAAIERLLAEGLTPDLLLLSERGIDAAWLARIQPMTAVNARYYADSIKTLAQGRRLVELHAHLGDALNNGKTAAKILEDLEARLLTVMAGEGQGSIEPVADALPAVISEIEERMRNPGKLPGIPSGFGRLDFLTGGFMPGQFIVVGARPSQGKTAFALNCAAHAAEAGFPVGFFSLEQSHSIHRLISSHAGVNSVNMRTGYLNQSDFARIFDATTHLARLPLYFDNRSKNLSEIRSNARRLVRRGARILFVDYLTLISHGPVSMSFFERVSDISHGLKALAGELNVPFVVLSQLRREAEDRKPVLSDLRMSGELEQDADLVIFLHRDRKAESGKTAVDIAKQRNGPLDEFHLMFVPQFVRFEEMSAGLDPQ